MADRTEPDSSLHRTVELEDNRRGGGASLSVVDTDSLIKSVDVIPTHYPPPPPLYPPRRSPSCPSPRLPHPHPPPHLALSESPPLLHPRVFNRNVDSTQSELVRRRVIGQPISVDQFPPPLVPRCRASSGKLNGGKATSVGSSRLRHRDAALEPAVSEPLTSRQVKNASPGEDINMSFQPNLQDKLTSGDERLKRKENVKPATVKSGSSPIRWEQCWTRDGECLNVGSSMSPTSRPHNFTNNNSFVDGGRRVGDANSFLPTVHKPPRHRIETHSPGVGQDNGDGLSSPRTRVDGQHAASAFVLTRQPQSVNIFIAPPSKPSQSALDQVFVLDHWPLRPSLPTTLTTTAPTPTTSNNIHLTTRSSGGGGVPKRRLSGNVYVEEPSSVIARSGSEVKELPSTSGNVVSSMMPTTNQRDCELSNHVNWTPPAPHNTTTTDKFKPTHAGGGGGSQLSPSGGCDDEVDRCQEGLVCPRCGRCRCAYCTGAGVRTLPSCWVCAGRYECSVRTAVDYCSCLCAVRTLFYHCLYHEDDDVDIVTDPCACGEAPRCCLRWSLIGALLPCVPCLLCYYPLRCMLDTCDACRAAWAGRRGCHCMDDHRCTSSTSEATTSTSTNTRSLLMAPENSSS